MEIAVMTTQRKRHWVVAMIGMALWYAAHCGCGHIWSVPFAVGGMAFIVWSLVAENRLCKCRGSHTMTVERGSAPRNRSHGMVTLLLIALLVLALTNGVGGPRMYTPDVRNVVWTILVVLFIVWLLVATGVIGHFGYWSF